MNLINNYNDLNRVFDKYNVSTIDFKTKLTIDLPLQGYVDKLFQQYMSNVEISRQHEYVGAINIDRYNIFNNLPMYNMLLNATNLANEIMSKSSISILNSNKDLLNVWKIYIADNLLWNLPFTLEQVIFVPLSELKRNLELDSYYELSKTLIHERIHVLQRLNPQEWIDYIYYQNKNWILVEFNTPLFNFLNDYNVNKLMDRMRVINPDTVYNDFKYVLKSNGNLYWAVLFLNPEKQVKIQWFQVHNKNNTQYDKSNYSFYLEPIDKDIYSYEHPFEEFAYKISNDLTKVILNKQSNE